MYENKQLGMILKLKNLAFEISKVNGGFRKRALVSYTDDYRLYIVIRDLFMLMYAMTRHLGGYETLIFC